MALLMVSIRVDRMAATGVLHANAASILALIEAGVAQSTELLSVGDMLSTGYRFGAVVMLDMARSGMGGKGSGYATFDHGLTTPDRQS